MEREPRRNSILAMRRGSAVHKAAEHFAKEVKEQRRPDPGELREVAATTFDESIDDSITDLNEDPDLKDSHQIVGNLVDAWVEHVAPTITTVELVEPYLTAKIEIDGMHLELEGYPDLIDVDEESGQLRVRDYKTGKTYSPKTYTQGLQMPMYTLLATANGMETDLTRIDHLRHLKSGAKHESIQMRRGTESHERLARVAAAVANMQKAKAFVPNPTSWMCSSGCDFWNECQFRRVDEEVE